MEAIGAFLAANAVLLIMILCWEVLWKLMAMWRAARKRQPVWFVLLAVLNTGGILPILYLIFTRRED